jgi:hypothetical protein
MCRLWRIAAAAAFDIASASLEPDDLPPSIHYGDAMADFIYQTRGVRKASSDKIVLGEVTVNFSPDAKVGAVGPNGAPTSNVLRVIPALTSRGCSSNPASSRPPKSRYIGPPLKPRARKQGSARRVSPRHPHLGRCAMQLRCNKTAQV